MIASLLSLRFKNRAKVLLFAVLAFAALGFLSIWLFTPQRQADVQLLRQELPEVLTFLGILGESSLGLHVAGSLFGVLVPLLTIFFAVHSATSLVAKPFADGRMAMYTASGHKRLTVLLTLSLLSLVETALILLATFAGQLAGTVLLFPQTNLLPLLRLNAGALAVLLVYPSFACLVAVFADTPRKAARLARGLLLLTLLFSCLSRLPGWLQVFANLSPLTWVKTTQLLAGTGGWLQACYALCLSMVLLLVSVLAFNRREL